MTHSQLIVQLQGSASRKDQEAILCKFGLPQLIEGIQRLVLLVLMIYL